MRQSTVSRTTSETSVSVSVSIDGTGKHRIQTGVGFFDHMLEQLSRHSLIDLDVVADGDRHVDDHHTVEDTGIAIGKALADAAGERIGIRRYGACLLPMDDALVRVALDLSGRPHLVWNADPPTDSIGTFDTQLVREFFNAVAIHGGITLHIDAIRGINNHHVVEATFKAFARALRSSLETDSGAPNSVPSTKGTLTE
ncbi:MAG: imidazoleglycerol-phosphate dehydratase HisB [Paracoccaceae bacterium]|nr:imidazoleglycerol-phosphate dehydratase HisB [Paracoccaceae bacterium]MDE2913905.1 imidazoleglycerol-phosphate dehydratase HisB [Paracoccaceae bacterium]